MRRAFVFSCLLFSTVCASAQTSNVQTVKGWRRTHIMGLPGGSLRDPTGRLADGQRMAALQAAVCEGSNIVAAAQQGLTNALERLWEAADATNNFVGRLYIAADMDADPDVENVEAFVVSESVEPSGLVHYYTHYTRLLDVPPKTVWAFEPLPGVVYWASGTIDTNAPMTNILGYACYDIRVQRPPQTGNIILRTNKFLKWGSSDSPLDVSDAGLELVADGVARQPYTGSVAWTNGQDEVVETYLSGFLYVTTTNQVEVSQ